MRLPRHTLGATGRFEATTSAAPPPRVSPFAFRPDPRSATVAAVAQLKASRRAGPVRAAKPGDAPSNGIVEADADLVPVRVPEIGTVEIGVVMRP